MRDTLHQIRRDLKLNRQIESYATAFLTLTIALLSFFGDIVSPDLRWAACTMGIGLLVLRSTTSKESRVAADSLGERPSLNVRIHCAWPLSSARGESVVVEVCRHEPEAWSARSSGRRVPTPTPTPTLVAQVPMQRRPAPGARHTNKQR
jgi:hypothetical protein